MYDTPDFYLVDTPIDRYSIGDRTPGLHYGDDGSNAIYLHAYGLARARAGIELAASAGWHLPPGAAHQ